MAQAFTSAMALASPTASVDIPRVGDVGDNKRSFSSDEKLAVALLTPPDSISPELPAHAIFASVQSPPPINIEHEPGMEVQQEAGEHPAPLLDIGHPPEPTGTPLSKGALSGLDASAAITPAMLAKHHLPGIMLGNGPRPIRFVMGELTQSVPGFSRIPPAKARRLVVAALESRQGGGPDGNVAFCKTGWGRWDAHIKGSSTKDSAIGSFNDGHLSPPRSERSSYAISNGDSAVHMPGPRMPSGYRDQLSGGCSWTASSLREEDEELIDMDMDVPENEADKMSLDGDGDGGGGASGEGDDSSSMNDDTDDDDWAAVGPAALRKASLPTPGAPRMNYNALGIPSSRGWSRRPEGLSQRGIRHPSSSSSLQQRGTVFGALGGGASGGSGIDPATATPEEQAAVAALLSLGGSSM